MGRVRMLDETRVELDGQRKMHGFGSLEILTQTQGPIEWAKKDALAIGSLLQTNKFRFLAQVKFSKLTKNRTDH